MRRTGRLRGGRAFYLMFHKAKPIRSREFTLLALPSGNKHSRFGCIVRRQGVPQAVRRNRLKRWLREAFRRNKGLLPQGMDVVVVVFQPTTPFSFRRVEEEFLKLCRLLT